MRILGIDPGEKRIGLAISDPLGITAQSMEVITYSEPGEPVRRIRQICREFDVDRLVVGNPLHMSGAKGIASEKAELFAELLRQELDLPVELIDERLTSSRAEQTLIDGGTRRKKRKNLRDKLAAVFILETYLARMHSNSQTDQ